MLRISNLYKKFPAQKNLPGRTQTFVHAINGVDLIIPKGKTVGLVGESGCGKSTLGRIIVGLDTPDAGDILFKQKSILNFNHGEMQNYRRSAQIIFQNPMGALNPRQRIYAMLREVLKVHRRSLQKNMDNEIAKILADVGMNNDVLDKYPFEFSGGQRQRLCIARALAVLPELIVCDEPVSALDVSVQSQILKLLKQLQVSRELTYLFISHDLSVVYHLCDYIYIMYLGKIVEQGTVTEIFQEPKHPYTQALISAIPIPDPQRKGNRILLHGEIPDPSQLPAGCFFSARCPQKMTKCDQTAPQMHRFSATHSCSCHLFTGRSEKSR